MPPRVSSALVVAALVALAGGAAAIAYGRWSRPFVVATEAAAHGDTAGALRAYAEGDARFRRFPSAARLLRDDQARLAHNQLALLYRSGQYDAVLEQAEHAPPSSAPDFWAGCAFFAKSRREERADSRILWLVRAEEAFKRALQRAPDDWDAKYNYELSARLAAALRRDAEKKPASMMPLLRPQPTASRQPVKKVG